MREIKKKITESVDALDLSEKDHVLVYRQIDLAEAALKVLFQTLSRIRDERAEQVGYRVAARDLPVRAAYEALVKVKSLKGS